LSNYKTYNLPTEVFAGLLL